MLPLSMKCSNSALNGQSSRLIIVDRVKLSLIPKLIVFWVSSAPCMLMYFFWRFFFQSHHVYDHTQCFSYFTDNSMNSDWVHLLLSYNGYPLDGALVGAGSFSPNCCCTLFGWAGAGTWTASSIINRKPGTQLGLIIFLLHIRAINISCGNLEAS